MFEKIVPVEKLVSTFFQNARIAILKIIPEWMEKYILNYSNYLLIHYYIYYRINRNLNGILKHIILYLIMKKKKFTPLRFLVRNRFIIFIYQNVRNINNFFWKSVLQFSQEFLLNKSFFIMYKKRFELIVMWKNEVSLQMVF